MNSPSVVFRGRRSILLCLPPEHTHLQGFEKSNIVQDAENQIMVQLRYGVMMQTKEWTKIAHNPQLDVELLHAFTFNTEF